MGYYIRTFLVELHAVLFGITVAFTGVTLDAMVENVGVSPSGIAALAPLAALCSSLVAGGITDRIGRRRALLINAWTWVAGYATIAVLGSSVVGLYVGRALTGCAMGATSVVVPVYVTETSPVALRGQLGGLFNVFISLGILCVFALGIDTDAHWGRVMAAIALVPALVSLVAILAGLVPETPTWFASQGRLEEARQAALAIFGKVASLEQFGDDKKRDDATAEGQSSSPEESPWDRKHRRALVVGVGAVGCFVFTGNNLLQAFMNEILAGSGVRNGVVSLASTMVAVTSFLVALAMFGVIEHVGRRPLLLSSSVGVAVSLGATAVASQRKDGAAVFVLVCVYALALSTGLSTLSWVYAAEVFPDAIRGRAMGVATTLFWGLTSVQVLVYPALASAIGVPNVLWTCAACSACSAVFVYFYVVETSGRTLEEIQGLLHEPTSSQTAAGESNPLLGDFS